MKTALMVLNPRRIPACIKAINALPVDKCWLSYMSEPLVAPHFNAWVRTRYDYDRFVILSDDASPSPECLAKVLELHDANPEDVATGYCNLDSVMREVNLTRNVLPGPVSTIQSYELLTQADVDAHGDQPFETTFAGFSLTCASRDLWLEFPLDPTLTGGQMDYSMSYRLQLAGVPIWTHRDTGMHHVKEVWNAIDQAPEKRLLVGERPPEVRWTYAS